MTKDDLRDILVNNEQAQQDPATEANTAEAQTADFGRPVSENAGETRENSVKNKFSQIFHQMYSHIKMSKFPSLIKELMSWFIKPNPRRKERSK